MPRGVPNSQCSDKQYRLVMNASVGLLGSCFRMLNFARSKITFLLLMKCELNFSFTLSYFFPLLPESKALKNIISLVAHAVSHCIDLQEFVFLREFSKCAILLESPYPFGLFLGILEIIERSCRNNSMVVMPCP